jgi:hypothetical protein
MMSQSHSAFQNTDLSVVKEERFVFKTEWFDKQAELLRPYLFTFYPKDQSAEMVSLNPTSHISFYYSMTSSKGEHS